MGDGSPVGGFWNVVNSQNILFKSMVFDFAVQTGFVNLRGSAVAFDGVTVKHASGDFGVGVVGSTLGFAGSPSLITENPCLGLKVGPGASVNVVNATISANGFGQDCGSQRHGIKVEQGGALTLSNGFFGNTGFVDQPVDISGNSGDGIVVEGGTLTTAAERGTATIHVHDNGGAGLEVFGHADIEGHLQFDGNTPNDTDGFGSGHQSS